MGSEISFVSGIVLLFMSGLVMKAYWPTSIRTKGWWYLGLAIFLGFLAAAINTAWWQVGAYIDREVYDWLSPTTQSVGLYLDAIFKGLASLSAYLHLMALRQSLPEDEQKDWSWYQMPGYPRKCKIFTRARKKDE